MMESQVLVYVIMCLLRKTEREAAISGFDWCVGNQSLKVLYSSNIFYKSF